MITHVVLFQLKDPKAENAAVVADRLRAMEGRVAGLTSITVGLDIGRGPRAYEVCLITTHADADALDVYQRDPIHGEVKAFVGEVAKHAAVVDFDGG